MELEVAGIAHLEASPEENAVRIGVANPEGHGIMLKLTMPVLIQMISALAKEGGILARAKPDPDLQFLFTATECELAVTDAGDPILVLLAEGGLEVPLLLKTEALSSLFSALVQLQTGSVPSH